MLVQRASFLVSAKTIVSSGTLPDLARSRNSTRASPSPSSACASARASGFGLASSGVIGEGLAQRGLLFRQLGLDVGDGGARCFRAFGVGLARRRIKAAIGGLARAKQILLLAHELGKLLAAFGKTQGHRGKRIRRTVLQRPLRQLEALGAVCDIACPGAVKRPCIGPQAARILRENRLSQPAALRFAAAHERRS